MPKCSCEYCGKQHYVKPCRMDRKHFCSHECYSRSMEIVVEVECNACGKTLLRKPSTANEENFCDLICRSEFRQGKNHPRYKEVEVKLCKRCGKEMSHRANIRWYSKYCSVECRSIDFSGDKNKFWKGGTWKYSSRWSNCRKKIRERDGHKCKICGATKTKRELPVHHIDKNKKNFNLSNLITLCDKCHIRVHRGIIAIGEVLRLPTV